MITALILIGTWPFWGILFLFACAELFLIEGKEDSLWVTATTLGFLTLVLLFTDWKPLDHWEAILAGVFVYFPVGVLYAAWPRWIVYIQDKSKSFEPTYKYLKERWDNQPSHTYKTFDEALRAENKMPPLPWDYGVRDMFATWVVYWPVSAGWMLARKPLEWLIEYAYAAVKEHLVALSYKIFTSHFENKVKEWTNQ